ncbi:alpha-ketoacid dehydrogenase subunit alpha/beta [Acinetobacter rudis]|uniref:Thiamine pyrophosphate-dependent enzyme n=1 Tax=Acinetobacter rudis TaxID=632955 RepID=A0AAW8JBS7_9GAMM|nr:thiamine pyrophosphate-dependent enzyme [Acinetobacter rudis]MDQ8936040.1 thiamine pyrophosphate-dependent enzyme [Acinetobacter rudis]MDQ9018303.1 thiamine pyrophosphate-dependent enzyme [Acinetobacter rudis]
MSNQINLHPESPWIELQSTQEDWNQADPALLESMLTQLHIIRAFEESVLELAGEGLVHGPAHSSIGQEGGAVGSIISLTAADQVNGSHRGHHQFLAKALTYLRPNGMKAAEAFGPDVQDVLQRTLAEILGLAQGFCKGRGGSMHLQWIEAGALGTNAIVGGGAPMAAGAAWAHRHAQTDAIAITYFGDGAVNIGSVLETMNLAAAWKLPICFFIENNRYAVSTSVEEATAETRLSSRGAAFNIPSWKVDGMDPLAVHLTMQQALQHMREGKGPTIVEADVYRFFHQNGPYPGSAFGYRSKDEEQAWKVRDPIVMLENQMIERGLIDADQVTALRRQCQDVMAQAVAELTEAAEKGKRRIRPELWPAKDFVDVGIRGDLSEIAGAETQEEATFTQALVKAKFIDAVANVMNRRMETDDSIMVMGEDIHRLKGGTNGATKGLKERFPERTLGTPISENAFMGLGGGIAVDGRFKPVVEFMYPDFMWVAADQVFNQIGKARHMFGGQSDVPLVLRTKIAMGTGYGSQHSMDPAGIFVTNPGWRIVAASTPFDYIGLMNFALACNDPVLVIEHVDLYSKSGLIPESNLDYQIPFGQAAIRREGKAVTILTYLSMVNHSLEAVEQTGVDVEVIDLRFLDRASLDWDTIEASIRKTNNVLIVEQGNQGTSYGGWLSDEIQRRCFDWLDQPIQRVHGTEGAPSISKVLERAAAARTEEVVEGLQRVMRDKGEAI